jgi:4-amino-4-deoxy-L-arabinose transferase-like glycosyltransferase
LTIRANGELHFDYLPMFYWMEAVSMSVFGFTDFAAKLPAAICGLLLIILTFFIARELTGDDTVAIISAWVLMLTQYFMKYATHAMSDVPFTLFFACALFFYLKGLKNKNYFLLFGLAVGFAIMTRTVLGVIPFGIGLTHLILTRQFKILWSTEFIVGTLLAIALPLLLYVAYYWLYGDAFLQAHFSFIWTKTVSGEPFSFQKTIVGLFEYPFLLLKLYEPWLIFSVIGFWWQLQRIKDTRDSASMLLVLWVCLVILPFSLVSAKVLRYIMPVFPALAILAAMPLSVLLQRIIKPKYQVAIFSVLCVLMLAVPFFSRPRFRAEGVLAIAPVIASKTDGTQRVVLYTSGELHHDVLNQLIWYTDRLYTYLADPGKLQEMLRSGNALTLVVDKKTFDNVVAPSGIEFEIVGRTDDYVCIRMNAK